MLALAIVGNKEDFKEYEKVEENKARDFAKENKALFMKTSAKTKVGIEDLFNNIAANILKQNPQANSLKGDDSKSNQESKKTKSGCCSCI